jgi:glycosyltransferase involved in cell wall biosynthesis
LALGRLVGHKRIDLLLRVWDTVRDAVGGTLLIAGDGPDRVRLMEAAGPDVEFLGRVSEADKEHLLGSSTLLVHAAMHEGWGMVISEAAALGTPALAFDVPGVRDALTDGATGRLVHTERELGNAWIALAADPRLCRSLGDEARRRAGARPWSETTDGLVRLLEDAIEQQPASRIR